MDKIVIFDKFPGVKYLVGYINNAEATILCILIPKMNWFLNSFVNIFFQRRKIIAKIQ